MDRLTTQEFSPTDFVAVFNQTIDFAYNQVVLVGELSSYRVSRGRWVYFDLKDEYSRVSFFGSVHDLPGPLEDGMILRAMATPRLHPQFGFSLNFSQLNVAGTGSLKRAADLLTIKLEREGLFDPTRKRTLPAFPEVVALVSAKGSAAESDFYKIAKLRWPSLGLHAEDALVQGAEAPESIVAAIARANQQVTAEVVVITRGGGSVEDLAAFNDERVVRAIAASRLPSVVAIGHEKDFSLAELAADARASTPTDAAMMVTADAGHQLEILAHLGTNLDQDVKSALDTAWEATILIRESIKQQIVTLLESETLRLRLRAQLVAGLDPLKPLKQGYALVSVSGKRLFSVTGVNQGNILDVRLADGTINASVEGIN